MKEEPWTSRESFEQMRGFREASMAASVRAAIEAMARYPGSCRGCSKVFTESRSCGCRRKALEQLCKCLRTRGAQREERCRAVAAGRSTVRAATAGRPAGRPLYGRRPAAGPNPGSRARRQAAGASVRARGTGRGTGASESVARARAGADVDDNRARPASGCECVGEHLRLGVARAEKARLQS